MNVMAVVKKDNGGADDPRAALKRAINLHCG